MTQSRSFRLLAAAIIAAGAWTALMPFVGPTFGYGMPPGADVPAWEWNASHFQRHVLPGVGALLAGGLLLAGARGARAAGGGLALLAGTWMIVNPFVVRAWLELAGRRAAATAAEPARGDDHQRARARTSPRLVAHGRH